MNQHNSILCECLPQLDELCRQTQNFGSTQFGLRQAKMLGRTMQQPLITSGIQIFQACRMQAEGNQVGPVQII
jgi:hypothetical protein